MSYYIFNGTFYAVPSRSDELYHYGVPGMKWGKRKQYQQVGGLGRRSSGTQQSTSNTLAARQQNRQAKQAARNTPEAQAQRAAKVAKAKKAAKIGAAVVGTALAAYGTYKLAKYVQGKRSQAAMQKAQDYIDKNVYRKWGDTTFKDGTRMMDFRDGMGNEITMRGARSNVGKAVGKHNARVVAEGRQMYKDATNTKLDRGLAKVVDAGDTVGKTAKNAANATKTAAKNAGTAVKNSKAGQAVRNTKNKVLDAVNPIYEYTPHTTRTTRSIDDPLGRWTGTHTEEITNYIKTKKRRT